MSKSLRVLVVIDSEAETQRLLAELRLRNYAPEHSRVETAGEMLVALQQPPAWDVVLSDYKLPHFSAAAALNLLQEAGLKLPFIVVSGPSGEAAAAAIIKAGAVDFLAKGSPARLGGVIEHALEAVRRQRVENQTAAAASHLAAIIESNEDAIYSKDLNSLIVSWNPAAERLFGYRAEEVIGRSISLLYPVGEWDEMLDNLVSIGRDKSVGCAETFRKRKDGRIIPISATISPIKDTAGRVVGASTIARDITAKKLADEDRIKLIEELSESLEQLNQAKAITGRLPVCPSCKRIQDDQGCWQYMETFLSLNSPATGNHPLCPECDKMDQAENLSAKLPGQLPNAREIPVISQTAKVSHKMARRNL